MHSRMDRSHNFGLSLQVAPPFVTSERVRREPICECMREVLGTDPNGTSLLGGPVLVLLVILFG